MKIKRSIINTLESNHEEKLKVTGKKHVILFICKDLFLPSIGVGMKLNYSWSNVEKHWKPFRTGKNKIIGVEVPNKLVYLCGIRLVKSLTAPICTQDYSKQCIHTLRIYKE